jgi:hypothetical protein
MAHRNPTHRREVVDVLVCVGLALWPLLVWAVHRLVTP